jgi:proline iminopeptidase
MSFPAARPFRTHQIQVSSLHRINVEEFGNPEGKPVAVLHGGPGAGISAPMSRLHDPEAYRMVLFDQRGCGKSTPHAELTDNTTWDLVADMEVIRRHLGIERWQVFGGSWGSCLGLAYALTHPERTSELILRGIFTLRRQELDWFYQFGASEILPEAFARYRAPIPADEQGDLISAYHRRLIGDDVAERNRCALAWTSWEAEGISLLPDPARVAEWRDPDYALAFARIEAHYFVNRGFFERDDHLLAHASQLTSIPGIIVQGRYDICTPITTAWALHQAWPEAEFRVVDNAGHAMTEPGIRDELIRATEAFKGLV